MRSIGKRTVVHVYIVMDGNPCSGGQAAINSVTGETDERFVYCQGEQFFIHTMGHRKEVSQRGSVFLAVHWISKIGK